MGSPNKDRHPQARQHGDSNGTVDASTANPDLAAAAGVDTNVNNNRNPSGADQSVEAKSHVEADCNESLRTRERHRIAAVRAHDKAAKEHRIRFRKAQELALAKFKNDGVTYFSIPTPPILSPVYI